MIRECFKTETGIMFTSEGIRKSGIDPANLYPLVQSKRPPPLPTIGAHIQEIPSATSLKQKSNENHADTDDLVKITKIKTEEEHEFLDALSPIYDQLSLAWFWWILELIPIKQRYQKGDNSWGAYLGWNLGKGRFIPKQKKVVKVHRSVKMRMDAQLPNGQKYIPKASFQTALDLGNVEWVD